jgi:hypothetical protein
MKRILGFAALLFWKVAAGAGAGPAVTQHMVLLEPLEGRLQVRESLIVSNGGSAHVAASGVARVHVPDAGVGTLSAGALAPGRSPAALEAVPAGRAQVYTVNFAIPPGETRFDFSYSIPFQTPGTFSGRILHQEGTVNLVVPAGVSLKGEGVEFAGQEPRSQAAIYSLKGSTYKVEVQGGGSIPSGAGGNSGEGGALSKIQPRIYDGLYTILGLLFAVLAVGFVMLYRKH